MRDDLSIPTTFVGVLVVRIGRGYWLTGGSAGKQYCGRTLPTAAEIDEYATA